MHTSLQPGRESSRYSASFREPHLLDSNVFLDMKGFVFDIEREKHDEERAGGTFGFGQRFGDIWSASIRTRFELIDMTNIESDASVDIFEENGEFFWLPVDATNNKFFPLHIKGKEFETIQLDFRLKVKEVHYDNGKIVSYK